MSSTFNEQQFEQKLTTLKDTQEAITALSEWCIKHKQHHKKIVNCWLYCFKKVKVDLRLTLFHLANDVIQHSKRKHLDFVESWGTALQKATPLVRDEKVKQRILRIFKIWEERGIYDEAFIADLCGLITVPGKKKSDAPEDGNEFPPSQLLKKIKDVKIIKENADLKLKKINDNKLPLTDAESMRLTLKERRQGSDVTAEVDSGVKKMEAYIRCLEAEIGAREKLLCLLREALLFYEKERSDAKAIVYAYRNFGTRLKKQQLAVEKALMSSLSPLPSPDVNAPSPSPDSDLEARIKQQKLPGTETNGIDLDLELPLVNTSFIGSSSFLDLSADVFSSESAATPTQTSQVEQKIEVIGNHDASSTFDVGEFFKTFIQQQQQQRDVAVPPPPTPPVFTDWSTQWEQPQPEEPVVQNPPDFPKPVHHMPNIGYDPTMPAPPMQAPPMQAPPMHLPVHVNFENPPPAPEFDKPMHQHYDHPPLQPLDVDHRLTEMPINPLPLHHDIDHRRPVMPNMEIPPPCLNEGPPLMPRIAPLNMLPPPPPPPIIPDVDQRNLISLTGERESYHNKRFEHGWKPQGFRIPEEPVVDNVESIDMDFSEDDDESHLKADHPERMLIPNHPPPMHHMPPPPMRPSLNDRLRDIQSFAPKVPPDFEQMPLDNNGYHEQEEEMSWQPRAVVPHGVRFPRLLRPGFPFRPMAPFRGRGRPFRPRARW